MPAHHVTALNWATESDNKIHDDTVARRYGFGGGLVPGVAVFAYLVRPVAELLGEPWLGGGSMSARFLAPVYDGEHVVASADAAGEGGASLAVRNDAGGVCATGSASLDPGPVPELVRYPAAALPDPDARPPAGEASLAEGTVLGSLTATFRADRAPEYLQQVGDELPLWQNGVAHPGWLLLFANLILSSNVRLGPWIHVSSDVQLFRPVRDGDIVETRGQVARLFERKGHRFVELDLVLTAAGEPAWHITHTAIYSVRPKEV